MIYICIALYTLGYIYTISKIMSQVPDSPTLSELPTYLTLFLTLLICVVWPIWHLTFILKTLKKYFA